jgi:hypothetical protein
MIEPYMIAIWIGILSFLMVLFTVMDLRTPIKDDVVFDKKVLEKKPIYTSFANDYEDVDALSYYEEDSYIQGD